jgi:hypothetical protein
MSLWPATMTRISIKNKTYNAVYAPTHSGIHRNRKIFSKENFTLDIHPVAFG